MTKQEYIDIRDNPILDIIPVLHHYHNHACGFGREMVLEEFRDNYSKWIMQPVIYISQSKIIETVFKKMDKIMDV